MKIIFDCTPLITLIEKIKLHDKLYQASKKFELIITPLVFKEFSEKASKTDMDFLNNFLFRSRIEPDTDVLTFGLHDGEVELISLAKQFINEQKETSCVICESPGRLTCELLGIPYMGTIGFLKLLEKKDILSKDELTNIKHLMINLKTKDKLEWLSDDLINEL